jgi:hypothetical protein
MKIPIILIVAAPIAMTSAFTPSTMKMSVTVGTQRFEYVVDDTHCDDLFFFSNTN